jgi:hypothetical protein
MSHHKTIFILDGNGDPFPMGHVRITNDGEVLSIWISGQQRLFFPEEESS